ncbi:hypothetical protein M2475_000243 [Breznakia sp. PF5-3]|uniref:post-transcriptional regulator n=1 Tax=unclassified Breznakia TaxID=2623764 RepID=UPI0024057F76|nr:MULTISPECIES: post-transcriptional regulator [unclassified Breznakia]MDF9823895.1 hypothetical protein [Breznakia sp. PM6-1]MDF9834694.1 hypothetical protein [Breznakia sp. PF5-3]MDF9836871.1 hypothetical protein [Breznakia sp. PFB2-8]MDF9858888.1 hypothetical protein [Breznakia sp. PH5-24]
MVSEKILNDKDVQLALTLKTNQLKREKLHSLTYKQVLRTLTEYVWRNKNVTSMHIAVNDIMKLDVSVVVAFLSLSAIEKGSRLNLDDINGVLRGELDD